MIITISTRERFTLFPISTIKLHFKQKKEKKVTADRKWFSEVKHFLHLKTLTKNVILACVRVIPRQQQRIGLLPVSSLFIFSFLSSPVCLATVTALPLASHSSLYRFALCHSERKLFHVCVNCLVWLQWQRWWRCSVCAIFSCSQEQTHSSSRQCQRFGRDQINRKPLLYSHQIIRVLTASA